MRYLTELMNNLPRNVRFHGAVDSDACQSYIMYEPNFCSANALHKFSLVRRNTSSCHARASNIHAMKFVSIRSRCGTNSILVYIVNLYEVSTNASALLRRSLHTRCRRTINTAVIMRATKLPIKLSCMSRFRLGACDVAITEDGARSDRACRTGRSSADIRTNRRSTAAGDLCTPVVVVARLVVAGADTDYYRSSHEVI